MTKQNNTKFIQVYSSKYNDDEETQYYLESSCLINEFNINVVDYDVQIMDKDPNKEIDESLCVYVTRSDRKIRKLSLEVFSDGATKQND